MGRSEMGEWDRIGILDKSMLCNYFPGAANGSSRGETCYFPLLSLCFSQSVSLQCCYWNSQTSASSSQYLVIFQIISLPYMPGLRLIKAWRNYLISIGPIVWKRCLSLCLDVLELSLRLPCLYLVTFQSPYQYTWLLIAKLDNCIYSC